MDDRRRFCRVGASLESRVSQPDEVGHLKDS